MMRLIFVIFAVVYIDDIISCQPDELADHSLKCMKTLVKGLGLRLSDGTDYGTNSTQKKPKDKTVVSDHTDVLGADIDLEVPAVPESSLDESHKASIIETIDDLK